MVFDLTTPTDDLNPYELQNAFFSLEIGPFRLKLSAVKVLQPSTEHTYLSTVT